MTLPGRPYIPSVEDKMVWTLVRGAWKKGRAIEQAGRLTQVTFHTGEPKKVYSFSKAKLRDVCDEHIPGNTTQSRAKTKGDYPKRVKTANSKAMSEECRGPLHARIVEFVLLCVRKLLDLLSLMIKG